MPTMRLKVYDGQPSWWEPLRSSVADVARTDPLALQIEHFAAVIRDGVQPICSGRDGLNTLKVVDAVSEAARTGRSVDVV